MPVDKTIAITILLALPVAIIFPLSGHTSTDFNSSTWSVSIDNDGILGTDENYSNGLFLEYHSERVNNLALSSPWPYRIAGQLFSSDVEQTLSWNWRIGQQMWTPSDIESQQPVINERPYAGLLFVDLGINRYQPNLTQKYQLRLGTVGPRALAKHTQKTIHDWIGSDKPNGWNNQIKNQWIANFSYQQHNTLYSSPISDFLHSQWDVASLARASIGNDQSDLAAGISLRWGQDLTKSLGAIGFTPGEFVDVSALSASRSGYFFFTGIEGRYKFNDITIEGKRPDETYPAHLEPWQASVVLGGVFYRPTWGITLSLATHTKEFKQSMDTTHSNGSVEFFWRFPQ
ncbi:TPA: lipid A deacylase LpxR family protein [Photobacterium damselae]